MLRFLAGKPRLGIEITSSAVRVAVISGYRTTAAVVYQNSSAIPEGIVNDSFTSSVIGDEGRIGQVVRDCLAGCPSSVRRISLSLPDNIFRVQSFEFDEFPFKLAERERLVRWRLEKAAAFDISNTYLRLIVDQRQDKGYTVLACLAKAALIGQYESVLIGLGYEPWSIGPSSFHVLNFYSSMLTSQSGIAALTYVSGDAFTTIITSQQGVKFYRFKDVKRGLADDIHTRLVREIDDSLHFYRHMDRLQQSDLKTIYLAGDAARSEDLANDLVAQTGLSVERLSPSHVLSQSGSAGPDMSAALGAGLFL